MEPWFDNAKNITEIAIVYPKKIANIRGDRQLKSAVRMLSELKQQFDVVTLASDWSKYKVLIFPDDILFDEETARRVVDYFNGDLSKELCNALMEVKQSMEGKKKLKNWEELVNQLDDSKIEPTL